MSESVPAGWYPTPDGKQKYWDGERWTNLPWDGEVIAAAPSPSKPPRRSISRRMALIVGGIALVVLLAIGGGLALKFSSDAAVEAAAVQAAEEQDKKEAAAQAAQDKKDYEERKARTESVAAIEASVRAMAEDHVTKGVIDGPIISTRCSPVGGGSTDDLTEQTTVFECFVGNKDNGDGTQSGYTYHATMNWDSGEYTYGLGAA